MCGPFQTDRAHSALVGNIGNVLHGVEFAERLQGYLARRDDLRSRECGWTKYLGIRLKRVFRAIQISMVTHSPSGCGRAQIEFAKLFWL